MQLITTLDKIEEISKLASIVDAVLVANKDYTMRYINVFSKDQIKLINDECETSNLQVYVNVNRFFMEEELDDLTKFLFYLDSIKISGVYYTDLCVFTIVKENKLNLKLVYNPETLITNSCDANAYKELGNERIVLAKELSLEEIINIINNCSNTEVLIHGHLNMMDSKRELLSYYKEFTSIENEVKFNPNLTIVEEKRNSKMPIYEDQFGTHVFTSYLLNSFRELEKLTNLSYARIDSVFMDQEEKYLVLKLYNKLSKGLISGEDAYNYFIEHSKYEYDSAFYYSKTILKKEGV